MNPHIRKILERAEAATPNLVIEEHNERFHLTNGKWGRYGSAGARLFYAEDMSKENAEFFKSARTDVPLLCILLQEALEALEQYKGIPSRDYVPASFNFGKADLTDIKTQSVIQAVMDMTKPLADKTLKSINEKLEKLK